MATRVQVTFDVRNPVGDPIAAASVALTTRPEGTAVSHYAAETGGAASTASFATDANGRAARWVEPGRYTITVTHGADALSRSLDAIRGDAVTLIAAGTIGTAQFADNSVETDKLASNAITSAGIFPRAATEAKFGDAQITKAKLGLAIVTNDKIASGAVTTTKILNRSVWTEHINSDAIGGPITSNELAANAVTTAKIADGSVLVSSMIPSLVTNAKLADGAITTTHIPDRSIPTNKLSNSILPVGMVIPYGGTTEPSAYWKFCNFQELSRTGYPELFALLSTTYGVGNNSTTFNLPDLRGRTLVGVGTASSVNALGDNEGIPTPGYLGYRGPKHGHSLGTFGVNAGGTHGHTYSAPINGGVGACTGNGPDRIYGGNTGGTMFANSHTHAMGGLAGDPDWYSSYNADQVMFGTVNYLIKVLPSVPAGGGGGDS